MIAIAAILFAATPVQQVPGLTADQEAEIVVTAQKARSMRWSYDLDKVGGVRKCKVTRTSGDAEIDQLGCEATRECAAKGFRKSAQMAACIRPRWREKVRALAMARGDEKARRANDAED